MAKLYNTKGKVTEVNIGEVGTQERGDKIRELIDGYFAIIHLKNGKSFFINENGMNRHLPVNEKATMEFQTHAYNKAICYEGLIFGNVVEVDSKEIN
tara:strand:- start:2515 stop:2805 length:291 start_codon:yes stop_codon:yes gene_type:complete